MNAHAASDRGRFVANAVGSVVFFWVAPGTLAGYLPWLITRWRMRPALLDLGAGRWLGAALFAAGLVALVECFARFVTEGSGTPAPVAPPRHLVVKGLYAYVRNPMYVAVVTVVLGQALWFGSARLLEYTGLVWLGFIVFVTLYEEPTLHRTFGAAYKEYCANVPRWWPRFSPWRVPAPGPPRPPRR